MSDRIFLKDLRTEVIIGIFDWERRVKQTISLDIEIPVDIRKAAASDRIEDTVNYKALAKRVLTFVEASEYQLVETLAEHVALMLLKDFDLDWVKLTLNKPGAIRGSRDVGVAIERSRADLARGHA
jgi:7,8-dihydroneopterin aldolase/epimerase/oxygenase